jgi:putative addiction module killer protein
VIEIQEYIDAKGHIPCRDWVVKLDTGTQICVITAVLRMGNGNFSAAKGVGSGVSELRLDFGPGYRIYFGKDGERLVILLGGAPKDGSKPISTRPMPSGLSTRNGNGRNR